MIKKFENSLSMAKDIILIDDESFRNISYTPELLCEKIQKNINYEVYIYYENSTPIGYVGILFVNNLHYNGVWIDLIAVRENYRNNGYGERLVTFVKNEIVKQNAEIITALIKTDNKFSLALFDKLGFKSENTDYKLYIKSIT